MFLSVFNIRRRLRLTLSGLFSAAFLAHAAGYGEEATTLSLTEAIALSLRNNPGFQAEQARLGLSEAEIITAGLRRNPSLMSDSGIAEYTYRVIGLEQTLELGGKRRRRVAAAQARKSVAMANLQRAALDLKSAVRQAYTDYYYRQACIRTYQHLEKSLQTLLAITEKQQKPNALAALEQMDVQIQFHNIQNDLQIEQNDWIEARNRLNTLLNVPLEKNWALAAPPFFPQVDEDGEWVPNPQAMAEQSLPSDPPEALIETAFANRPELQRNLAEREVSHRDLALAKANRIPNLSITAGPDLVVTPPKGLSAFIIANMTLPVFDRQQGAIQSALSHQKITQAEEIELRNQIRLEVANTYNTLLTARARILRYEQDIIPLSRTMLEKTRANFETGESSILATLATQRIYTTARQEELEAFKALQNALNALERAVGYPR